MTEAFTPTFLGLGVPRAGTTWLHEALASHPDIAMPARRKELHYFDQELARGPSWYREQFGDITGATAIGEITPHYLFDADARTHIVASGIPRFVVILRDPVARAISHHRFRSRVDGISSSFDSFLRVHPEAIEWGRYVVHLRPWFDELGRDAFCVLRFEDVEAEPTATLHRVATFLSVDPTRFPEGAGTTAVNESVPVRRPRSHALAKRGARRLRRASIPGVIGAARWLRLDRVLTASAPEPFAAERSPADLATEVSLRATYGDDLAALEALLGWDLQAWR
jgi:Sulfotransferase domain